MKRLRLYTVILFAAFAITPVRAQTQNPTAQTECYSSKEELFKAQVCVLKEATDQTAYFDLSLAPTAPVIHEFRIDGQMKVGDSVTHLGAYIVIASPTNLDRTAKDSDGDGKLDDIQLKLKLSETYPKHDFPVGAILTFRILLHGLIPGPNESVISRDTVVDGITIRIITERAK